MRRNPFFTYPPGGQKDIANLKLWNQRAAPAHNHKFPAAQGNEFFHGQDSHGCAYSGAGPIGKGRILSKGHKLTMEEAMAVSLSGFGRSCRIVGLKRIDKKQAVPLDFRFVRESAGGDNSLFKSHVRNKKIMVYGQWGRKKD
jgi:hypothetical protein